MLQDIVHCLILYSLDLWKQSMLLNMCLFSVIGIKEPVCLFTQWPISDSRLFWVFFPLSARFCLVTFCVTFHFVCNCLLVIPALFIVPCAFSWALFWFILTFCFASRCCLSSSVSFFYKLFFFWQVLSVFDHQFDKHFFFWEVLSLWSSVFNSFLFSYVNLLLF